MPKKERNMTAGGSSGGGAGTTGGAAGGGGSFYTPENVAVILKRMDPDVRAAVVLGACSMNFTMFAKNMEACLLVMSIRSSDKAQLAQGKKPKTIMTAEDFFDKAVSDVLEENKT